MALIDHTFFEGDLLIPGTNDTDIQDRILYFTESVEDKLLTDILGHTLFNAMAAGLAEVTIDQKWLDLRDGKEYTGLDGYPYKWMGLTQVFLSGSLTIKRSLIANYVYCEWLTDNVSQTVAVGEAASKAENSAIVSPKHKIIRAWNQMIGWICELKKFLDNNIETYPEWEQRNNFFQLIKYRKRNILDI